MLYRVRLSFGFNVSAANIEEAHSKACKMLSNDPEAFISGFEDATVARPKDGVLKRLITGQ